MYMQEREGLYFVEAPAGFLAYKKVNADSWYVQDIYVLPEARKSKLATKLFDKVVKLAQAEKVHTLLGSVDISAPAADVNLKAVLSVGFKPQTVDGSLIWFSQKI